MGNPILVEVRRGGVLESFHRGVICVVNKDNEVIFSRGNTAQVCYPRSALKFFQHIPLLESGAFDHFGFTPAELAVMCGSHNGEPAHLEAVDSILGKAGLDRSYLKCGAQYPSDKRSYENMLRSGEKPQPVHNNCSGKHAGFLAMCVFTQTDPNTYLDPHHPIQQLILKVTEDFHEYPAAQMVTALDGCSAPIFSIPVINQAIAYKNLVNSGKWDKNRQRACEAIVQAVSANPFMVAGTGRYCTDMMEVCGQKIIGKTGAEGIYSMTLLNEQVGVCIKIDDGKMLPQYHVAQGFISHSGLFGADEIKSLGHYERQAIRNFNKLETGEMKLADGLFSGLHL